MMAVHAPGAKRRVRHVAVLLGPGLSVQAQSIWMLLRDKGGYWNAADVARHFEMSRMDRIAIAQWLRLLAERGYVKRHESSDEKNFCYGVTTRCKVPDGLTMELSS